MATYLSEHYSGILSAVPTASLPTGITAGAAVLSINEGSVGGITPVAAPAIVISPNSYKAAVGFSHARVRVKKCSLFCPVFAAADIVKLFEIPSNARCLQLLMRNATLGTTVNMDIGLYDQNGNTVDSVYFASAVNWGTARATLTDLGINRLTVDATSKCMQGLPIWRTLLVGGTTALNADPGVMYGVRAAVNGAVTAPAIAGVYLELKYTAGD